MSDALDIGVDPAGAASTALLVKTRSRGAPGVGAARFRGRKASA